MENQSLPAYNQSPNHWKTTTITLLIALTVGVVIWIFKSQTQPSIVSNIINQKPLTQNIAPINSIIPQKEIMDSEIFQTTGNCTIDECEAQEEGDFFDHTDFIG